MTDRAAVGIVAAGVAGVLISAYLTVVHYAEAQLACVTASFVDCDAVTTSSYSFVPGTEIPVALAGIVWSAASAAAGILALRAEPPWLRPAQLAWSAAGVAAALYLIYAEIAVIGAICEWCTALHVLIVATFFLALSRMQRA